MFRKMEEIMNKGFDAVIKCFDESHEKWERDRCKLKENKESKPN